MNNRSIALLSRLGRLNPTAVFLAAVIVVFGALLLPGPIGGVILFGTALSLAALLVVTWPRHTVRARAFRLAVLALLVALAVARLH